MNIKLITNQMNKIKKTYHVNGSIDEEYEVNEEGAKNGYYKLFHDNGQLQVEISFSEGNQNPGTIISYHNNGVRAREVILSKNGNFNGAFTEWHYNGNIKTQGYHKDDEKFVENEFYENGVLIDYKSLKLNNEKIREAFKDWLENEDSAKAKYGHISNWNTSEVTDITDIYFIAKSMNIDITNWSLNFEENGLFFKQNKSGNFVTYHENGNKRIEYLNANINEGYEYYSHLCSKIGTNKDTKISTYDENGKELKEVAIFLTPNKGDSMIVFKTAINNYANFQEGNFTETNYLSNYINDRHHIINLTGSDEFDLKKYPPVIISVSSQEVLRKIAQFIPDKKFVLIFRWKELCINLLHFDEIWRSANNKDEYGNHLDEKILDFPGSKAMEEERDYLELYNYNYDYLRLYEEEVFNDFYLKVGKKQVDEQKEEEEEEYHKDLYPYDLELDVEEYKRKMTFK